MVVSISVEIMFSRDKELHRLLNFLKYSNSVEILFSRDKELHRLFLQCIGHA